MPLSLSRSRERAFVGALIAGLGLMMVARAHAQPQPDLTHSWVRSFPQTTGTGSQSYVNGVAVLDTDNPLAPLLPRRGTVVVAGHSDTDVMILAAGPPPRGFVAFLSPDQAQPENWLRHFVGSPTPGAGAAACTGVSVCSRLVVPQRHAFVSGWFSGTVDFQSNCSGGGTIRSTNTARDAFLAKLDRDSTCTQWVTTIGGTGHQEALAVAAGPPQWGGVPILTPVRHFSQSFDHWFTAVGGYFNPSIEFQPGVPLASNGGDDAFVAIVQARNVGEGNILITLRLGGSGHERITAVAVDPVDQGVIVAGYYSSTGLMDLDFDPHNVGNPLWAPPAIGSNDIFVARYRWECLQPGKPCLQWGLLLDWLYTTGTSGDDQASGVGVDVQGRAYATGFRSAGANGRDIWLAKVDEPPDNVRNTTTLSGWGNAIPSSTGFVWGGSGDDRGLGLTVDGLDRVIVTGQFAGTVNFNPIALGDARVSAGGLDLFVTRFAQTWDPGEAPFPIQYDGTFTIGGVYDEVGSAIAIEGLRSQRLAHAGWFGAPNSPNGYTLDFDPGSGIANRVGTGGADGFVNSFLPTVPPGVKAAVTLTLETSQQVTDSPDYVAMLGAFKAHLPNAAVTPQDERLALNAVMYEFNSGLIGADRCADQVLPWTVFRESNARVFARRLAHQPRRTALCRWQITTGLRVAQKTQEEDGISACYRGILVVAGHENGLSPDDANGELRAARDEVLDPPDPFPDSNVDQINAIAVRGDSQVAGVLTWRAFANVPPCNPLPEPFYLPDFLVDSDAVVGPQPWGLGLALHTIVEDLPAPQEFAHPSYSAAVERMLKRSTRCPGDFDRDGDVQPDDFSQFFSAWSAGLADADWNFDGCVTNEDFTTFNVAHQLGCSCP